jgi:hypothetical protein
MADWQIRSMAGSLTRAIIVAFGLLWLGVLIESASAQTDSGDSVEARLDELEQQSAALADENRQLKAQMVELRQQSLPGSIPGNPTNSADWLPETGRFITGYDDGFVISPVDPEDTPFSLKFNNQTMFRYTGFARDVRTFTDSAGIVTDVTNRSQFEIPRGRLIVSGNALLPNLGYYVNIDYNTVTSQPIGFRGYWLSYRFSRAVEIFVGQNKVPGSREWLMSSFSALGPDRSLATTFFRPSLSQGIWFTGEPLDGLYYHAMVSNGFNTLNTPPDELDSRLCWSGSLWWEPWGSFGKTFSDLEWHDEAVIRCGTSLTYATEQGQQGDPNAPENADIRLSNGTLITETGAFAPGVTLQTYKIGLATFDFGWKQRGLSVSGELYLQDLFGLHGDGPLPVSSTFACGGYVQAGWFVLAKEFEIYGRTSQVSGAYGAGGEYAGGFNWYFLPGKNNLRFTLDAAWINHSPADQNRTDYRAGDTGILLRTQIQTLF